MEQDFTTRLGSKVIIDEKDDRFLYGRYWSGEEWIPCRWFTNGKFFEGDGVIRSLDLNWKQS